MNNPTYKQGRAAKTVFAVLGILMLFSAIQTVPTATIHAQQITGDYTLLSPLPCLGNNCPGSSANGTTASFKTYVSYAYNLFIALGAVTAVFMIVLGGFEYVTSTIPGVKTEGLGRIKGAVGGLVLILASYLILRTINPNFVQISDSLVPQIQLNQNGQNLTQAPSGDFFSQLNNESQQYADQNHAASAASVAASNDKAQTQTQLDGVNQQISQSLVNSGLSDEEIDTACLDSQISSSANIGSLCAQRSTYMDKINLDSSTQASQTLSADFNTALQNASSNSATVDSTTLLNFRNQLDAAYAKQISNVTDPAQRQAVDDQYSFASQKLEIQQYVVGVDVQNPGSISASITLINQIKNDESPDIQNPTLRAQSQAAADSAISTLQNQLKAAQLQQNINHSPGPKI